MTTVADLYTSITNHLRISHRAVPIGPGNHDINVGEIFTLKVTIENMAPNHLNFANPKIIFLEARANVIKSEYATPVDANGVAIENVEADFRDVSLAPGDTSTLEIRMKATRHYNGPNQAQFLEQVAHVQVRAKIDKEAFFQIRKFVDPRAQIRPT